MHTEVLGHNPTANSNFTLPKGLSDSVRQMLIFESEHPKQPKPWSLFTKLKDWKQYAEIKGWRGRSSREMRDDTASGASAFYQAFRLWVHKTAPSTEPDFKTNRKIIRRKLLPIKHRKKISEVWSDLKTIQDWQKELKARDWEGRSTKEMLTDSKSGARSFYYAFFEWALKKISRTDLDYNKKRRNLRRQLFPLKPIAKKDGKWSHLKTVEEWKNELIARGWEGFSAYEMKNEIKLGTNAFYLAFLIWVRKEVSDSELDYKTKRRSLSLALFPKKKRKPRKGSRVHLETIEDWKKELEDHNWLGRSVSEMERDVSSGASACYAAFIKWLKNTAPKTEPDYLNKRRAITQQLFTINLSFRGETIFSERSLLASRIKVGDDLKLIIASLPDIEKFSGDRIALNIEGNKVYLFKRIYLKKGAQWAIKKEDLSKLYNLNQQPSLLQTHLPL